MTFSVWEWILFAATFFNAAGLAFNVFTFVRHAKYFHKEYDELIEKMEFVDDATNKVFVLHALLSNMCIEAFQNQHTPIWKAWAGSFGGIEVTISGRGIDPTIHLNEKLEPIAPTHPRFSGDNDDED